MVLTISAAGAPRALWWALPDNHRRMGVRTNIPTQTISFPTARSIRVSHAWYVYGTMISAVVVVTWLPIAPMPLAPLFFVARACSNSARSDPRHVRMLSESSTRYTHRITTIGCVVRVEARAEERAAGSGTVGAGTVFHFCDPH